MYVHDIVYKCVCVCAVSYIRTPACLLHDPTDLSLAHETADPVTAILLLHNHFAFGAVHGFPIIYQGLEWESSLVYFLSPFNIL